METAAQNTGTGGVGLADREYHQTDEHLDNLLARRPGIANNRVHSDKAYAIANCPGATDRVIPVSLICEDLDEFICSYYGQFGILARKSASDLTAPVCVGDYVSFRIVSGKIRRPLAVLKIEVWKNNEVCAQTFDLTLIVIP